MKTHRAHPFLFLLIFSFLSTIGMAQEESRTFALPDARVGEEYRTDIETVLRETYGLRLEADKHAIIQWLLKDGELTPGLALRTNGVLTGAKPSTTDNSPHS